MIGVGIAGCGAIAKFRHVPEFSTNPNAKIVGYFNPGIDRAMVLAEQYGGKVYSSYQELLESEEIHAVCICSPNMHHASMSIDAMKAGKHVLCEKPIAASEDEAISMIECAHETGVCFMVAHDMKFEYANIKAKEILESGELGSILTFRTSFGHMGPEYWSVDKSMNSWFFNKNNSYMGALGDLGIHKAHLISWLIDDTIEEVSAFLATRDKKKDDGNFVDVSDNAICLLRSKTGIIGTLSASWTNYGDMENSTVVYCSKGILEINNNPQYQIVVTKSDNKKTYYNFDKQTRSGVVDSFIESIINKTPSKISGEEGYAALKIISECLRAQEKNMSIKIK